MLAPAQLFSASQQNLWRLAIIRMMVLVAQGATLWIAYASELIHLDWMQLIGLLVLSFIAILLTLLRLRLSWPVTEFEFAVQLGFDIFIHSALLYYTGGSTNPFVAYYLVPLTIAAATLSWMYSLILGGLALTGYTALLIWFHPLHMVGEKYGINLISLHLFGMWLNFALSAVFIIFFVVKMAGAVRNQDLLQAVRREEAMRDQQLLAVATQAAGAAHELGTPLSTMSVLLAELEQSYRADRLLHEDVKLLQGQVKLCRETLQQLVRASEADRNHKAEWQPITQWMKKSLDRWHLMRPEATYSYQVLSRENEPSKQIPADVTQALLNVLNNAADACPDNLIITLEWSQEWISVKIKDHGSGVPLAIAEQLGKPFITTKGKGFGLGLFLTQASVNRAGGTVKLYNHATGGTLAELRLPCA